MALQCLTNRAITTVSQILGNVAAVRVVKVAHATDRPTTSLAPTFPMSPGHPKDPTSRLWFEPNQGRLRTGYSVA